MNASRRGARRPAGAPPVDANRRDTAPPSHLIIGRVRASWGRRGEVRAEVLTDFPERFGQMTRILVGEEHRPYRLSSARLQQGEAILKLEGIDTPEQAGELRGEFLYVPVAEAMPLATDVYYHYQILGLEVYTTSGKFLGQVTDILETGANDVYVVRNANRREVLIPALAEVVQEVDLEHHRMLVTPPPGLVEEEEA